MDETIKLLTESGGQLSEGKIYLDSESLEKIGFTSDQAKCFDNIHAAIYYDCMLDKFIFEEWAK